MATRFPMSKAAFGQYLKTHAKTRFVRGSSVKCPLAKALTATLPKEKTEDLYGFSVVYVDDETAQIGDDVYDLPKWASQFVYYYDGNPQTALNSYIELFGQP